MPLVTGGSGLARFLPNAFRNLGLLKSDEFTPTLPEVAGRSLIVAGSCSTATNAQVTWMRDHCPHWSVDVATVMDNAEVEFVKVREWAQTSPVDQPLLIYSSAPPDQVTQLQNQFGRDPVANALETFLARVTCSLVDEMNVRRLILAGGETSGAIVAALGIEALSIGPEICVGVPWTESFSPRQLALALKSGNFGEPNFFQSCLLYTSPSPRDATLSRMPSSA